MENRLNCLETLRASPKIGPTPLIKIFFARAFLFSVIFAISACQSQSQIDSSFLSKTSSAATIQTDSSANQFAGGRATGVAFDATSGYVRLSNAGGCDGTASNCGPDSELDANWTPEWNHLKGYWKLNEASGAISLADSSLSGANPGIASNVTLGVAGQLNSAATLAGNSTSYIQVNSNMTGAAPNVTMSAWVYPTSSAAPQMLFYNNGNQTFFSGMGYFIDYHGGSIHCGTGNGFFASTGSAPQNVWSHVVCAISGTTGYVYINGQFDSSGTVGAVLANTTNLFYLGGDLHDNLPFYGKIDDASLWDTALTAGEVATIYNRQSVKYAGTFTSRVMDGVSTNANWTNFSWATTLPFLKQLPDAGISEVSANYPSQTVGLMSGIWGFGI